MITPVRLEKVFKEYPIYQSLYSLVWNFRDFFSKNKLEIFNDWLNEAREQFDYSELTSFLNGLEQEKDAFTFAVTTSYSNGLAEGSINKLKTIKRQMYGRCSFQLLRAKVLLREQRRFT